ncbi:MAG: hypothetical protein QNK84_09560 [Flavobacteriales bacterium]|jgi:hypothetical protein
MRKAISDWVLIKEKTTVNVIGRSLGYSSDSLGLAKYKAKDYVW